MSVRRYWVDRQLAYTDPVMQGIASGDVQQMVLAFDYDELKQIGGEAVQVLSALLPMARGFDVKFPLEIHLKTLTEGEAIVEKFKALGVKP